MVNIGVEFQNIECGNGVQKDDMTSQIICIMHIYIFMNDVIQQTNTPA